MDRRRMFLGGYIETLLPAFAIYSLRKINPASSSCIQVTRSSDNTFTNIGFDSDGNLDEVALLAFVGGGNGTIRQWYDQSGNNNILVNTTVAHQPRIVISGVVQKVNGRPAVRFVRSGNGTLLTSNGSVTEYNFLHNGSNASVFMVTQPDVLASPGTTNWLYSTTTNTSGAGVLSFFDDSTSTKNLKTIIRNATVTQSETDITGKNGNNQYLLSHYYDANNPTLSLRLRSYINKNLESTNILNIASTGSNAGQPLHIGKRTVGTNVTAMNGFIQELIIYNGWADINKVTRNINNYYNIY
jgi:hypothetical protein